MSATFQASFAAFFESPRTKITTDPLYGKWIKEVFFHMFDGDPAIEIALSGWYRILRSGAQGYTRGILKVHFGGWPQTGEWADAGKHSVPTQTGFTSYLALRTKAL